MTDGAKFDVVLPGAGIALGAAGAAGAAGAGAGAAPQPLLQPVLQPVSQQSCLWNLAFSRSSRLGLAHGSQPQSLFLNLASNAPLNSGVPQAGLQGSWQTGAQAGLQAGAGAQAGAQGAGLAQGSQQSLWPIIDKRALILSRMVTLAQGSQHDGAGAQPPQSAPATQADVIRMSAAVTGKHLRGNRGRNRPWRSSERRALLRPPCVLRTMSSVAAGRKAGDQPGPKSRGSSTVSRVQRERREPDLKKSVRIPDRLHRPRKS